VAFGVREWLGFHFLSSFGGTPCLPLLGWCFGTPQFDRGGLGSLVDEWIDTPEMVASIISAAEVEEEEEDAAQTKHQQEFADTPLHSRSRNCISFV
jgi:hypothetical protein